EFLRVLLRALRQRNGGRGATLLIYDEERGAEAVRKAAPRFDDSILPLAVEEIGSVGLDLIAAALAYGANRVRLFVPKSTPAQSVATLEFNVAIVAAVLAHIGRDDFCAEIIRDPSGLAATESAPPRIEQAATFAALGDKRATIRAAFLFLHSLSAPAAPTTCPLPDGAPFGDLRLDSDACTLCMACVSVCPASALQAGGDAPALRLIEGNCVQCGICASACPESALTLQPRLHFNADALRSARTLKEEAAFHCIRCNKPFATESIIARMTEKLKTHWMFARPDALRRLRMCEDCRVTDLFEKEGGGVG
ncbi:MAG: 4Fe-4S binding protein, partial [bacterium]